jgi:ABC-type dipeptide/oligopeptide/nickel transport system permease component
MGFASLGMGIPSFLLGLTLILIFGTKLGWLPISGTGGIEHLILPTIALSLEGLAVSLRLLRSSMLEQFGNDYVRALHAKGLRRRTVVWRRVLRNALIPLISLSGIQIGALVGYTAIVEVVFRWPGLGQLLLNSVLTFSRTLATRSPIRGCGRPARDRDDGNAGRGLLRSGAPATPA